MKNSILLVFLIILLLFPILGQSEPRTRPSSWAQPIIGTRLENLYIIDEGVYRSEQPQSEDLQNLNSLGIREILSLREFHGDEDDIQETKIKLHRIEMRTGKITEKQIIDSLRIIQKRRGPILIHCWHGSDRTGVTVAAYRIIFNNWTKSEAIDEMKNGGYGYHARIYPELIDFLQKLDVKSLKKALAL